MSLIEKRRSGYSRKLILAAYASAAVASLPGYAVPVQAAVFEQTCNGTVVAIGDGALASAPSQVRHPLVVEENATSSSVLEFGKPVSAAVPNVPTGELLAAGLPRPSSHCSSSPVGAPTNGALALKAVHERLSLPAPRRLSHALSGRQLQMRQLAARVGAQFAHAPGVRKANLDEPVFVKLFTTLVHRESNFWPQAVSPAGARGLGQLMPGTARDLGVKNAFEPEENLIGAATYLTDMLKQFGSPELALAAYNAGPGAVAKHGGIPPYRETRQYVADIFHEVLREPIPTQGEMELSDVSRLGLAAFVPDTSASAADESPFDSVLAERSQQQSSAPTPTLLALSGKPRSAPPNAATAAQTVSQPLSGLGTLPAPREFGGALAKSQLAMRDLAVDVALAHSGAPAVGAAGLSEDEFVTLFVALIRRESSFNPRAVSPDGAKGLGQLTPDTVRTSGIKDPFAPRENLEVAASRLIKLLDQFGSPALAIAAHNASEGAIADRTAIPDIRGTRQLVADVLHDMKSEQRSDYIMARFRAAGRMDVALAGQVPGDRLASTHLSIPAPR